MAAEAVPTDAAQLAAFVPGTHGKTVVCDEVLGPRIGDFAGAVAVGRLASLDREAHQTYRTLAWDIAELAVLRYAYEAHCEHLAAYDRDDSD